MAFKASSPHAAVPLTRLAHGQNWHKVVTAFDQAGVARVVRGALVELGVWDRPDTPGIVRRHLQLAASSAVAVRR